MFRFIFKFIFNMVEIYAVLGSEKLLESGDNAGKGKCVVSALSGERTSLETGNLKLCGLKKSRTSKKRTINLCKAGIWDILAEKRSMSISKYGWK